MGIITLTNNKPNMASYSVNYANPPNHMDHNEFIAQVLCRCRVNAKNGHCSGNQECLNDRGKHETMDY